MFLAGDIGNDFQCLSARCTDSFSWRSHEQISLPGRRTGSESGPELNPPVGSIVVTAEFALFRRPTTRRPGKIDIKTPDDTVPGAGQRGESTAADPDGKPQEGGQS